MSENQKTTIRLRIVSTNRWGNSVYEDVDRVTKNRFWQGVTVSPGRTEIQGGPGNQWPATLKWSEVEIVE